MPLLIESVVSAAPLKCMCIICDATENGTELNETLPKLSPLNPQYKTKKQTVFQKIVAFIEKFKGVGGQI